MDVLKTTIVKKDNYNGTEMHVLIINDESKIFRIEHYKKKGRDLHERKGYSNFDDAESAERNFFSDNFSGYHNLTKQLEKVLNEN
jgi:hypothetical protein